MNGSLRKRDEHARLARSKTQRGRSVARDVARHEWINGRTNHSNGADIGALQVPILVLPGLGEILQSVMSLTARHGYDGGKGG